MEPIFKVGDTVYIKQLSELPFKPPFGLNEAMHCYSGKKAKIIAVAANAYSRAEHEDIPASMPLDRVRYTLNIDGGRWSWSLPMLSTVEKKVTKTLKEIAITIKRKSIHFNFSN